MGFLRRQRLLARRPCMCSVSGAAENKVATTCRLVISIVTKCVFELFFICNNQFNLVSCMSNSPAALLPC